MSGGFLCFPDELLNSAVHDAAGGKPRITPFAYMIIRDATHRRVTKQLLILTTPKLTMLFAHATVVQVDQMLRAQS
jgi:hypothetical protein